MLRIKSSKKGFTLVEIMIVVAIIGILVAIAVPGFINARTQSRQKACVENLSKIDGAKEQWALETNAQVGATPVWTDLVGANQDGILKKEPVCPAGGTYTIGALSVDPTCNSTEETKDGKGHNLLD